MNLPLRNSYTYSSTLSPDEIIIRLQERLADRYLSNTIKDGGAFKLQGNAFYFSNKSLFICGLISGDGQQTTIETIMRAPVSQIVFFLTWLGILLSIGLMLLINADISVESLMFLGLLLAFAFIGTFIVLHSFRKATTKAKKLIEATLNATYN